MVPLAIRYANLCSRDNRNRKSVDRRKGTVVNRLKKKSLILTLSLSPLIIHEWHVFFTCWNFEPGQDGYRHSSVEYDRNNDNDKSCGEDKLTRLRQCISNGKRKCNGTAESREHHHMLKNI